MKRIVICLLTVAFVCWFFPSCKEWVSPHQAPAKDEVGKLLTSRAVTKTATLARHDPVAKNDTSISGRTEITVNMVPRPDHPAEMEALSREIKMFEAANHDVKVHISMWRYTPEDFLDRARNRTLPDVVEVSVSQMPAIINMSYAVDITKELSDFPDYAFISADAIKLCMQNGLIYGLPTDLYTMALFYDRRILANADRAARKAAESRATPKPADADKDSGKKRGKGGNDDPLYLLAQTYTDYSTYQQQPQPQRRRGLFSRIFRRRDAEQQQQPQLYPEAQLETDEGDFESAVPGSMPDVDASATPAPLYDSSESDIESAVPLFDVPFNEQTLPGAILEKEIAKQGASIDRGDKQTTLTESFALPKTWNELAKKAVELTDHSMPRYGFAPVCMGNEGGRELSQWAIQSGVNRLEYKDGDKLRTDLSTSASVSALQWVRELKTKYDVMPPVNQCYATNLMRMFAQGNVAMMVLPANGETIEKLQRSGMLLKDIGVAKIPAGDKNANMLVDGKCMIINSQCSPAKRKAALRWMMFQHDLQRIQLRARILSREREFVGTPRVPIYTAQRQKEVDDLIAPYRSIPQFVDYEKDLVTQLTPQPAWFQKTFYEAVGHDLYRFLEDDNASPFKTSMILGRDFMNSALAEAPSSEDRLKMQLREFIEAAEREFSNLRKMRKK